MLCSVLLIEYHLQVRRVLEYNWFKEGNDQVMRLAKLRGNSPSGALGAFVNFSIDSILGWPIRLGIISLCAGKFYAMFFCVKFCLGSCVYAHVIKYKVAVWCSTGAVCTK